MIVYRTLFAIDIIAAATIAWFFFAGLADGSVSSFNMTLWLAILAGLTVVLGGGYGLNASGKRGVAIVLLSLLAVPALLYALFLAIVILSDTRWN